MLVRPDHAVHPSRRRALGLQDMRHRRFPINAGPLRVVGKRGLAREHREVIPHEPDHRRADGRLRTKISKPLSRFGTGSRISRCPPRLVGQIGLLLQLHDALEGIGPVRLEQRPRIESRFHAAVAQLHDSVARSQIYRHR